MVRGTARIWAKGKQLNLLKTTGFCYIINVIYCGKLRIGDGTTVV